MYEQLRKQIESPEHCFIQVRKGKVMEHHDNDQGLIGKPIRFTRLAAERIIKDPFMQGATIVLIVKVSVRR